MLKQIAVRLEEELIKNAKLKAVEEGISIQDLFKQALENYMGKPKTPNHEVFEPAPAPTPFRPSGASYGKYPNPLDYEPTDEDIYYILRKTAKTKLTNGSAQFQYGPIFWLVLDGCKAHFDKNGDPIPYRFTDQNGKVIEPDADELQELEEKLGKPVKIEK